MRRILHAAALALAGSTLVATPPAATTAELVRPSAADPAIRRFDDPNVVIANTKAGADAPLAIFMPGTGGRPQNVLPLLSVVASQGYRVIGLTYDDEPAGNLTCTRRSPPACLAQFREMRVFGSGSGGPVTNPPGEAIVPRLAALLAYLAKAHPDAGWGAYLAPDGAPKWDRIVVSGLSQGAGMAAFIAKRVTVARVVLFSSPWDVAGMDDRPAPWLTLPSATPPDRWWAERHVNEKTTGLLEHAYAALQISTDHILLFDKGLPPRTPADSPNPYHGSTVRNVDYAPQWKRLYGEAGR